MSFLKILQFTEAECEGVEIACGICGLLSDVDIDDDLVYSGTNCHRTSVSMLEIACGICGLMGDVDIDDDLVYSGTDCHRTSAAMLEI